MSAPVALPGGLAERLRLGTQELHRQAERSPFMARLVAGRIDAAGYAALLANLQRLYAALEAALQAAQDDAAVALLPLQALRRAPALAADRAALQRSTGIEGPLPCAATEAYVQRLQQAAPRRRLVAHAYLRYLGDLHGGQLVQRQVQRALGEAAPVAFYDFGPPERVAALRGELRAALAAMPLDEAGIEDLVEEARWGYRQHQRLFEALAAG